MVAPTELALSTLLPTVSYLPPALITLANSLLAQSRAKAASLKPEEEIGRIYACAHIACERLKRRLDLEVDKPKPPCKPKVYQKLYTYLDGALSTPRTPTTNRKKDALSQSTPQSREQVSNRSPGGVETPSKTPGTVKTPTTGSKRTRAVVSEGEKEDDEVPHYVMHMIRAMCKATSTPTAVPHILVGARSVVHEIASRVVKRATDRELPSSKRRKRTLESAKSNGQASEETESAVATANIATAKWPALLVTLHTYVVARMLGLSTNEPKALATQTQAIKTLQTFATSTPLGEQEPYLAARLNDTDLKKDITFYTLEAEDCGWLDMDWYKNIPENMHYADEAHDDDDAAESERDDDEQNQSRQRLKKTPLRRKEKHSGKEAFASGRLQDEVGAAGLLPGLGTMFQGTVDWLSDERREDYKSWKEGILNEVAVMEANARIMVS